MSNKVDERVVQMQFNNRQFESGIKESVSSLDKLKKGLKLDASAKSLSNLNNTAKRFDMSGISNGVQTIASKFSALSVVGITALANITNAAVNAGKQIASSLIIDPIKTGFNEYELKMNAIQTIMAGSGESLETVNKYLAELNAYSDRTIYSFSDMKENVGKFTNAGVKLDDAVLAIKGISNEAAVAGANAGEAARAMYNLSQAMSMGYVQLIDWKSIEMANMATVAFKTNILDMAVQEKVIKKTAEGMYITPSGKELNAMGMFKDGLQDQWLTSKVLIDTLKVYSDETTEIGKKAYAAAEDIKTLSQMYGVLKESAQSGWAQTWESIVGGYEESKGIFTQLNTYIGGFITASADARNKLAQFWKDNGGRDDLIQAFKNLNSLAVQIVGPIKEAFRELFPAMTGERLVALTKSFKEFTEKLKIGANAIGKIKKIAGGVFSMWSISIQFIKAVIKNIIEFIKWISPLVAGLTDMTSGIADWISGLDKSMKKSDFFNKVFAKLKWNIVTAAEAMDSAFKKMKKSVESFSGLDLTSFSTFVDTLKEKLKPLIKVGEFVDKAITWIGNLFKKMGPFFGQIGKGIGEFISKMNLTAIVQLFETGVLASIIIGVNKLIKSFTSITDGAGGFLKGITSILDGVKNSLTAWQQSLKAGVLLKIAIAIGILSVSLLLLSTIDPNKLASSLAAITTLFAELFGSMAVFDKIVGGSGFKSMAKVTIGMILLSIAVLILATAVKKLSDSDWGGATRGMLSITGMVALLLGASKLMSKASGEMLKSSVGLILFAVAVRVLADSLIAIAQLDTDSLIQGMIGLIVTCGVLIGMMAASKLGSMGLKESLGLVAMAIAIRLLASAVQTFGGMKPEQLSQGLLALVGVLAALGIFILLVDEKQMAAVGLGLVVLAISMIIFASAIKKLGEMSIDTLAKGLVGMAIAIGLVIAATKLMPPNLVAIGIGLLAISVGLLLIAKALQMIGGLTVEEIIKGVLGLGAALFMIVIAVNAVQGALVGAFALLVVTAALLGLAVVMKMLGGMSLASIGKALLAIIAVIVILGVAAAVIVGSGLVLAMLALGAALIVMGIGLAAVGLAALVLSIGLGALSVAGIKGVGTLLALCAAMALMGPFTAPILLAGAALLILSVGILAVGFALTILGAGLALVVAIGQPGVDALMKLVEAGIRMAACSLDLTLAGIALALLGVGAAAAGVGALAAGIGIIALAISLKMLSKVNLTTISGLTDIAKDLAGASAFLLLAVPGLLASGAAMIVFGVGATSTGEGVKTVTTNLVELAKSVKNIPDLMEASIDSIVSTLKSMIDEMVDAIDAQKERVSSSFEKMVDDSVTRMNDQRYLFYAVGVNLVDGFIEGIKSRSAAAMDESVSMALGALRAANKALDINSPSGEFETVGKYANKGLAKGLIKYSSISRKAASAMAENTIRPVIAMSLDKPNYNFGSKQVSSVAAITKEVQNGRFQQQANEAAEAQTTNQITELNGILTVQVKNDKGEIIGIAQTAVRDLLRRESR